MRARISRCGSRRTAPCWARARARLLERYPYFSVLVTVNGPEHDRYRRYPDGSGSLGRIMENLKRLRESRPEVWERQVHFIANVAGSDELPGLLDFYRRELGRPPDAVTHIRAQDADESVLDMLRPDDEALMERLRLEYCESGDPFLGAVFARQVQAVERRRLLRCGSCGIIGSCLPPSEKLFVHADGRFGVCETCCDKVIIGDLEHGFDREELHRLYCGAQRLFGAQCRGCWAPETVHGVFEGRVQTGWGLRGAHIRGLLPGIEGNGGVPAQSVLRAGPARGV